MSPCTLARVLLEEVLQLATPKEIREAIRDPHAFFRRRAADGQQAQARSLTHPTAASGATPSPESGAIDGESPPPPLTLPAPASVAASSSPRLVGAVTSDRWIRELSSCVQHDDHNSPFLDAVRNLTGSSYESLLESHLTRRGIPFVTEAAQRLTGLAHKTPDIRLLAPILVHGQVVNWIDSKAQFADGKIKQQHLDTQLRSYVNRFGKGMVIYWLDFVEGEPDACSTPLQLPVHATGGDAAGPPAGDSFSCSFAAPATYDNGDILLLTDFPSDLVTMDQLLQAELHATAKHSGPPAAQTPHTSPSTG